MIRISCMSWDKIFLNLSGNMTIFWMNETRTKHDSRCTTEKTKLSEPHVNSCSFPYTLTGDQNAKINSLYSTMKLRYESQWCGRVLHCCAFPVLSIYYCTQIRTYWEWMNETAVPLESSVCRHFRESMLCKSHDEMTFSIFNICSQQLTTKHLKGLVFVNYWMSLNFFVFVFTLFP
jgi:hypothetical protein